ncbi:mechanosensitive ion channel family protein [Polynucleobacter antarcticus]|uniref:Cyclic nucleotide-binding domain-containing protein n=1 Tax=Polynucleobacter antarcticus TaxID=1743162 RepID=A0A6M9PJ46_9BURK|nr:mechanosensitive ion channel family protein [Polynucleobacter antarcticus]QKM62174.1 hypothetical protein DCO16_03225 [Polynucleobacter antarcticus]
MTLSHEKITAVPKWALILLIIANIALAMYAYTLGKVFAFVSADLSDGFDSIGIDLVGLMQITLIAVTLDQAFRRTIVNLNRVNPQKKIPIIVVTAGSIIILALVGLAGFIFLFDRNFTSLIAASGAIGLGLGYIFQDRIKDIVASSSLQIDGLVSLGDHIVIFEGDNRIPETYQVVQMEHRLITLSDTTHGLIKQFYNNKFLDLDYINATKQDPGRGFRREFTIALSAHCDCEKVTSILNLAMDCVVSKNTFFQPWHLCAATEINHGQVTYRVRYECSPRTDLPKDFTNSLVLNTIMRFLKAGAVDFTDNPSKAGADLDLKNRLLAFASLGFLVVLNEEDLDYLAKKSTFKRVAKDEQLIVSGQEAQSMFLLLEGCLEVKILNADGILVTVASVWPGDIVGEMSLLTGAPRSADVFALTSALMIEVKKDDIFPILESRPELISLISDILVERQAQNELVKNTREQGLTSHSKSKALSKLILKFFFNE